MKLLVKMLGGSHMHGTNTETSDTDYLGVFLPEVNDLILQRAPKHITMSTGSNTQKNTKDDVDTTYYSLHYFLQLLSQGQTNAIEMISVPKEKLLVCTPEWEFLMERRKDFYTKNMKSFMGYCKSQAQIYSRKGERINLVKFIIDELTINRGPNTNLSCTNRYVFGTTVGEILEKEINLEELQKCYGSNNISVINESPVPLLNVCGRKFQFTLSDKNFLNGLTKILNSYGKRAEEVSKGTMDCKAVSHAFRIIGECREIAEFGTLTLPIKNRDFVMKVKTGQVDAGYCFDLLEKEIVEVENLLNKSTLPEKVNMERYYDWLLELYYCKED